MRGSYEKIEKVKQIAFNSFLEIGYEATTVRMICKAAEIEAPTLYYFFQSKKGVFLSLKDDLKADYSESVKGLFLEKCDTPEVALKKYFSFCISYALEKNDNTRFYLKFRLFKPTELVQEIEEYIADSKKERHEQYFKYIQELVDTGKLNCTPEYVFEKFNFFIDSNTFNIIFSDWRPSEEEINEIWNIFLEHYLNYNH